MEGQKNLKLFLLVSLQMWLIVGDKNYVWLISAHNGLNEQGFYYNSKWALISCPNVLFSHPLRQI